MRCWTVALLFVAACTGREASAPGPRLDPGALPTELRGIVPGRTTEAELARLLPEPTAVRDKTYGGNHHVELSGEPAIQVQSIEAGVEAWLIRIDGEVRVASLFARLERTCRDLVDEWGGRIRAGTCIEGYPPPSPGEHRYCAATPDGRYSVDLACFDPPSTERPGRITAWVEVVPARDRSYRVAPL